MTFEDRAAALKAPQQAQSPLQAFTLDALLAGAARLRAHRPGVSWSGEGVAPGMMTFGEWDAAASAVAGALVECGLEPGERVLIVGGADPASLALLFGAVRAGLEVALCPAGEPTAWIGERAEAVSAAALLAPGRIGAASLSEDLAEAAACAPHVRLAALWGDSGQPQDGLLPLHEIAPAAFARRPTNGALFTFSSDPVAPQRHRQDRLAAGAFDLMHRARLGPTGSIVSTLAPMKQAGLIAGPLVALASGARLHLHSPFESQTLERVAKDAAPAFCVVPAAFGEALAARLGGAGLSALALLHEAPTRDVPRCPEPIAAPFPLVDLWRWRECALAAEPRDAQGRAAPCPGEPHVFPLDEGLVTAIEWRRMPDGYELRGAACAHGDVWAPA